MDSRADSFTKFKTNGEQLIADGHFMAAEIAEKIAALTTRKEKMVRFFITSYGHRKGVVGGCATLCNQLKN